MIRHEYKGVRIRSWELLGTVAATVAQAAQFESAEVWDLVSFCTDPPHDNAFNVHIVYRRAVPSPSNPEEPK